MLRFCLRVIVTIKFPEVFLKASSSFAQLMLHLPTRANEAPGKETSALALLSLSFVAVESAQSTV